MHRFDDGEELMSLQSVSIGRKENMEKVIEVRGLVKRFGDKAAVNGVDLDVYKGEMFAFLGPNGAGKTTTVRVLSTLTGFDEGTVMVDGHDIKKHPDEAKTRIGVIQQHISLDKDLTVWENMMQHTMYHKIPKSERQSRIDELVEYVGLGEYTDYMVSDLSGGWKKRVSIVCALLHKPKILFLDEPTAGLDIQARRMLWDLIRRLNMDGTTTFLTTHYIEEAEALCHRVGIINKGRIIAMGTPQELTDRIGKVAVEYFDSSGVTKYNYFKDRESANAYATTLTAQDRVVIRKTSLEDCFVELTGTTVGGM